MVQYGENTRQEIVPGRLQLSPLATGERENTRPAGKFVVLTGQDVTVLRGPAGSEHTHLPNQEECSAETVSQTLKRKAKENPELPPAHILCAELQSIPAGILTLLPGPEPLKKAI